jgi:hypothetical protein
MNDQEIADAVQGDKTPCPLCPHPLNGHFETTGHCAAMKCDCKGAPNIGQVRCKYTVLRRGQEIQCEVPEGHVGLHIFKDDTLKPGEGVAELLNPSSVMIKNPSVLQEADNIINGQRQQDYGSPLQSFTDIAALWSPILGIDVDANQVALCMIGLKIARAKNGGMQRDSLVDIAGYAGCIELMDKERNQE